jgi:hypothetical protein
MTPQRWQQSKSALDEAMGAGTQGPYVHRSLSMPILPAESAPEPPNNQSLPDPSSQEVDDDRAPGRLVGAGIPNVPYCPGALSAVDCVPPAYVHWPLAGLYSHRSSKAA